MQNYPPAPDPRQVSQPNLNPSSFGAPIPAAAPGMPHQPPRSNRNKLLIGGGIGCGVLLVLCMCVGLLSAIAAMGGTSTAESGTTTTTKQQRQQQSPTSTPNPTATSNPNAGAAAYTTMVTQDSTTLGDDLNTVSTECGGQSISGCRAAVVVLRDDSANYLNDLDAQPTPPCLATVDKPLRAALRDLHTAAQEIIDGIDNYDVSKIDDGSALMRKATTEITSATEAYKHVTCT